VRTVLLGLMLALLPAASVLADGEGSSATPAGDVAEGRGLAVALLGASSENAGKACRDTARAVYAAGLAPAMSEATALALCAEDPKTAEARAVAEVRAALAAPLDSASARALLPALLEQTGARAVLLLGERIDEETGLPVLEVDLVRRAPTARGLGALVDPARFRLSGAVFDPAALAAAAGELFGAPACAAAAPCEPAPGPPAASGALAWFVPTPPAPEGGATFVDTPWFWVAAGGVAALGLTILIVSQTTDVDRSTIIVEGSVPP
jgi:hypothetical protein